MQLKVLCVTVGEKSRVFHWKILFCMLVSSACFLSAQVLRVKHHSCPYFIGKVHCWILDCTASKHCYSCMSERSPNQADAKKEQMLMIQLIINKLFVYYWIWHWFWKKQPKLMKTSTDQLHLYQSGLTGAWVKCKTMGRNQPICHCCCCFDRNYYLCVNCLAPVSQGGVCCLPAGLCCTEQLFWLWCISKALFWHALHSINMLAFSHIMFKISLPGWDKSDLNSVVVFIVTISPNSRFNFNSLQLSHKRL